MEQVEPKVFLIAETKLLPELNNFLAHIKAPTWESDATSDAERLIEVMGRLCYRSFGDSLNPNLTKVRVGNYPYLENIISSGHGSVLEHATVSFIFADVSRVFTHELVRHRAGVAISQESLRFVRLDRIKQWLPTVITEDLNAMSIAVDTIEKCEEAQQALAKLWNLGEMPFSEKKKYTSAMRRLAPCGVATTIGWTANLRALRHVLEVRTSRHAEAEIRQVFVQVGKRCKEKYPNLFSDFTLTQCEDGELSWVATAHKV